MNATLPLPKNNVASGKCVVSKGAAAILEAYLGTCVGVTLCDRQAGVGGLIHMLLPEPPVNGTPVQPEIYAATGLPLFIDRLCQEGAVKENLEASVAGGALVGPLTKQDLALDIGGRTAEIVERILRRERIPIRKSEIAGYFSCRLSLNLKTWESDIDPLGISTILPDETYFEKPGSEQLDRVIEHVRPIPQVTLKVVRLISEENYRLGDVAQEVMQDQVMSAKVISFCNSTFSCTGAHVDSIDRALFIVGERWLLQLIVAASLEEFLAIKDEGYSLCKGGLFMHARSTAAVAKGLAQYTGKAPPDLAYTAGLLHDIGKVVLDQYMAAARPLFYRYVQESDVDLIEAERELFGITHPEVGGRLARRWAIPENLREVIEHHHQPGQATTGSDLAHLVYLADVITSRFKVGQELEKLNTDALASSLSKVGLRPEQFSLLIGGIFNETLDCVMPGARN